MLKKQSVLVGLAMFAMIGYTSAASAAGQCAASYAVFYAATCKSIVQDIYVADTSSCGYYIGGGTAAGAGGLGGAALLGTNPYGLVVLAIGAIGTGVGAWGASACYNDSAAVKDKNLATCDVLSAKLAKTCEEEEKERLAKIKSSGNKGGGSLGSGNGGGTNIIAGSYSVCGTACKKGTVDIH